jgi:hypothetical protein
MHLLEIKAIFRRLEHCIVHLCLLVRQRPKLVAGGFVWEESKLTGFHMIPSGICFIYMTADVVEINTKTAF